jgi:tRNA threonylcarbamoyladenosine biosynthesis protein TsaE
MEKLELNKLNDLPDAAKKFLEKTRGNKFFAFFGDLGAGKTTFIKALCNELNVVDIVSSPTFSLINEYQSESGELIYHMDFYRIESIKEAYEIGLEDYFQNDNYCFIEWPEKIDELLPNHVIYVKITENKNGKRIIEFN